MIRPCGSAAAVCVADRENQFSRKRSKIRGVSATDFMPLEGWDHVELWVGNAKQAAYFYEHAFGFTRTAYAGPETGVRDRASYVLEQGEIRLVSDERPTRRQRDHPLRLHATATARRTIALQVPSAGEAYRAGRRSAALAGSPSRTGSRTSYGRVELASIGTYGDVVHTFVNRARLRRPVPARLRLVDRERPRRPGRRPERARPRRRQRRARPMDHWVELLRAASSG